MEQGLEMEVGHTTVVLEGEEEEGGHVKRVYQICNLGLAQKNQVSRTTITDIYPISMQNSLHCI